MNMHPPHRHIHRRSALVRLLALALASSSGNALAIGTANDQAQTPLMSEFRKLDRNSDGKLSSKEASRDSDISQYFDQADGNHDGTLSAEEYANFKSAAQKARVEAYLDDSSVTAMVKTELAKESGMKSLAISVQTYHGRVILSGFVDNAQQAHRAVEIASGVRGVHQVSNSLLLKKADSPPTQASKTPSKSGSTHQTHAAEIISANYVYIRASAHYPVKT